MEIVSLRGGRLLSKFGKDEDEYLPLGSETFFVKSDIGSVTFVRDAQGRVTGYTYHCVDGQEIHPKKVVARTKDMKAELRRRGEVVE